MYLARADVSAKVFLVKQATCGGKTCVVVFFLTITSRELRDEAYEGKMKVKM